MKGEAKNKVTFDWHRTGPESRGYFIDVLVNGEKVREEEFHPDDIDGSRKTMLDVIDNWQDRMVEKYS